MTLRTVRVFAPAKVNLTLHITGCRDDGFHLLDSLVAFAPVGDCLTIQDGNILSLTVEGPEAKGVPADMNNLALKAASVVAGGRGGALTLEKNLPVASGLGGGSADAAAAWRGMMCMGTEAQTQDEYMRSAPEIMLETHARDLLELGADVPMCLASQTCRARGIGEEITPIKLPSVPAVLVNPRVPVSTPKVFQQLVSRDNAPMPEAIPEFADAGALIDWLRTCRNDLEQPAIHMEPIIGQVIDELWALDGCGLARMSGSGATCFGLFEEVEAAQAAAEELRKAFPDWWIAGGLLGNQMSRALPVVS